MKAVASREFATITNAPLPAFAAIQRDEFWSISTMAGSSRPFMTKDSTLDRILLRSPPVEGGKMLAHRIWRPSPEKSGLLSRSIEAIEYNTIFLGNSEKPRVN
jgi:hypothetical protein